MKVPGLEGELMKPMVVIDVMPTLLDVLGIDVSNYHVCADHRQNITMKQ